MKSEKNTKKIILFAAVGSLAILIGVLFFCLWKDEENLAEKKKLLENAEKIEAYYETIPAFIEEKTENGWKDGYPDTYGLSNAFYYADGDIDTKILDLDGNGIKELLLGERTESGFLIYNIYTSLFEGDPVICYTSGTEGGLLMTKDQTFITFAVVTKKEQDTVTEEQDKYTGKFRFLQYCTEEDFTAYVFENGYLEETDIPESWEWAES